MPFKARLKKLQSLLQKHEVDAVVIDDPDTLFFLTGQQLSAGRIVASGDKAQLFVDGRYIEGCQENSAIPATLTENGVLKDYLSATPVGAIAFDSTLTSYRGYQLLEKELNELEKSPSLIAKEGFCGQLRSIKDFAEQQALKAAADLGSQGYDYLCSLLKEGVTERELALELEIFWRRHGGEKLAFDPIIAFGANSSKPHYHVQDVPLQKGQAVLMDIGVTYLHYNSDMTRTVFFGEPDPKMREIYEVVREAQTHALSLCKPGITAGDLDLAAREVIDAAGYGELFTHSLGHGIGLEVHEFPVLSHKRKASADVVLEAGMAITIEPGIYSPGLGGVRIEDTVILTEDGHDNLTQRSTELSVLQ